jgi:hypothetical protein
MVDDVLGEAEAGRSPDVASPNTGAGFPRAVGGDSGQDGPIFNAQKRIGCLAVPSPTNSRGTTCPFV